MSQFTSRNPIRRRQLPPARPPRGTGVTSSVVTSTATVTVTNTTTETTLMSMSIPAGAFTQGRAVNTVTGGTFTHTGSTGALTLRLKVGGSTVLVTDPIVPSTSVNGRGWRIDTSHVAVSTASQQTVAAFTMSDASTGLWHSGTSGHRGAGFGVSTAASTAAIPVVLSAQFSVASTGWSIVKNMAMMQQIR